MSEKNQKNFQEREKIYDELFDRIRTSCDSLIYISETDAPVLPFLGDKATEVTRDAILQQVSGRLDAVIEEADFDTFFEKLTTLKDWFGEPEKARAKKFLKLKRLLEENLRSVKVFRLGTVQIDIYVVGLDTGDRLAGVVTKAVET